MSINRNVAFACALVALVSASTTAHDFYIAPSSYRVAPGQSLGISLVITHGVETTTQPRALDRIIRFIYGGPELDSTPRGIAGAAGDDPAGVITLSDPGVYVVGYRSTNATIELPAESFNEYLREKGMDNVLAARTASGDTEAPGTEIYSRCAKTLVRVGDASVASPNATRDLGFTTELIPVTDPTIAPPNQPVSFRLMHEGAPVQDALVHLVRLTDPPPPKAEGDETPATDAARTDADGIATLTPDRAGVWRVNAVIMRPAPDDADQDWESWWASVTFEITGPDR